MHTYINLYDSLCSYENLELAYKKARKHKTTKHYVIGFEQNLEENLLQLRTELLLHSYKPKPLKTFILRDPKTRKISKSYFRDRVVHHALCNIIEPIFDKSFIYDSYANRKGKGTLKALQRFDFFKGKVTKNNTRNAFVLKADIKHYFEEVNHDVLIKIVRRKIKDKKVIWLIRQILNNHNKIKSMPLGNLTSQFFANIYLTELDYFIKHGLKIKYYIRYVDDFVVLHSNKKILEGHKQKINWFLKEKLNLELHPDKSKIHKITNGINLLGFRVFYYYKLLEKTNIIKMQIKLEKFKELSSINKIDYDTIYESFQGWFAYAKHADTYNLRMRISRKLEEYFQQEFSSIGINRMLKLIKLVSEG